ncbi:MAG: translation initiation factor IF-2 subunit beta [Promethearchaeota archaeon]
MNEEEYITLLDKAISQLPEDSMKRDRFTIPEAKINTEGNKTLIKNFKNISDALKRDPKHFLKFLLNEVGTAGTFDEQSGWATLAGLFSRKLIINTISSYVKEFVLCETCTKPDTVIDKQGRQTILVCYACGTRRSIRKI